MKRYRLAAVAALVIIAAAGCATRTAKETAEAAKAKSRRVIASKIDKSAPPRAVAAAKPGAQPAHSKGASANPTARDVLEKMAATYKSIRTLRVWGTIYASMSADGKSRKQQEPKSLSLEFARPNKTKLISGTGQRETVFVSDGSKAYAYMPAMKMYQEGPAPKMLSDVPELKGIGISTPDLLDGRDIAGFAKKARLLPSESVGGVDSYVIDYSIPSPKAPGASATERLWVGKEDYLIHQIRTTKTLTSAALSRMRGPKHKTSGPVVLIQKTVVRTISANVALPDSTFQFVPPKEAKKFEPQTPAPPPDVSGKPAPDFTIPDLEGKSVSLASYRGKPVVVVFWTILSKTATAGMIQEQKVHEELPNLAIVGINLDGNKEAVEKFVKENGITFPILFDLNLAYPAATSFGLLYMPTAFVIGQDGMVKGKIIGPQPVEKIKSELEALGVK